MGLLRGRDGGRGDIAGSVLADARIGAGGWLWTHGGDMVAAGEGRPGEGPAGMLQTEQQRTGLLVREQQWWCW